ncbi:UNVERIFIED_CONTAM: NAC domain-containing protein 2 [Sesamum radiatum]|uniref:NAC domain-containing protein 2 n=1 Tax=Sesamum radiatum TaxID=300843 RepID=A0AAW2PJG8_SESRA
MMKEMLIIPPGFHFAPTDQELITFYLSGKAMGLQLPWNPILEKTIYGENADPWDVFDDVQWDTSVVTREDKESKNVKRVVYVFTKLSKVNGKTRIARTAGSGTWDGQTGARKIYNKSRQVIGQMKMFTFTAKTPGDGRKQHDHWIMHEYSLAGFSLKCQLKYKDYVICRIARLSKEKSAQQLILRSVPGQFSSSCSEKDSSNHNELGKKRSAEQDQEVACQKKQKVARSTYVNRSGDDNFAWMSDFGYANAAPLQQLPTPVDGSLIPHHNQTDGRECSYHKDDESLLDDLLLEYKDGDGSLLDILLDDEDATETLFDPSFLQSLDNYIASTLADDGGASLQQPPSLIDECLMPQHDQTNGQDCRQEDESLLDLLLEYKDGDGSPLLDFHFDDELAPGPLFDLSSIQFPDV